MRKLTYLIIIIVATLFVACKAIIPPNALISEQNVPITLQIPSNLGSGHQWRLLDTSQFSVVEHTSISNPDTSQSTDIEIFKLKAKSKKGVYKLTFYNIRPFDKSLDTITSKKYVKAIIIK